MLTPEEIDEFKALWSLKELDDVQGDRLRQLQRKADVGLTCCEAIQDYPVIRGQIGPDDYEDEPEAPWWRWNMCGDSCSANQARRIRYDSEGRLDLSCPLPTVCPFCARPLPKMVRTTIDAPVQTVEDGGYYCSTCQERLMCCKCLPMTANWKPEA